tara:strand:+ start:741 stop:1136 length:396 start_codon:yes stop_codon:yes gene_type:complete
MSKKKGLFELVHVTGEDAQRELKKTIENLTDEQKSDFKFKGEYLHEIGSGHDFVHGWFFNYVTKSGVQATDYENYWVIDGSDYKLKDDVFVELPKVERKPIDWSSITFPVINNVQAKTIGEDLTPVQPKEK